MRLETAIQLFKDKHPEILEELLDPFGAEGICTWISYKFKNFISQQESEEEKPNVQVYALTGMNIIPIQNQTVHPKETLWNEVYHAVVAYNGNFIDWSITQFNSQAEVPTVYSREEIEKIWNEVIDHETFDRREAEINARNSLKF